MTTHNDPKSTQVPWYLGIIPFTLLIVLLYFVIRYFGGDALAGASQVVLLICTGSIIAIAVLFYHIPWENIEKAIVNNIKSIAMALLVLILIGAIAGSWMVSGVVPSLIYYGLQILAPGLFLLVACIVSALVSLITGSSWTTVATIGVALIGIGTVLGFSPAMTAGAIISGAYFGDKLSPLSDTTIVASSINEVPLFSHIRYMMVTTIPSFTIACVLFLVISLCHQNGDGLPPNDFNDALVGTFHISPWLITKRKGGSLASPLSHHHPDKCYCNLSFIHNPWRLQYAYTAVTSSLLAEKTVCGRSPAFSFTKLPPFRVSR